MKSPCCNNGSILPPGCTCDVCGTANWVVGWTGSDDAFGEQYPITEMHDASDDKIGPKQCTYTTTVPLP